MNNHFIALLILCLFSAGCLQDKGEKIIPESRTNTVLRSFSDKNSLDTFKIVLNGEHPKNMDLVFTITSHSGRQIYRKAISAKLLLDNYKDNVDLVKLKKQIQFIQDEHKLFLEEENFLEPAITEIEKPNKHTPDIDFFSELKQSGLNGFKYRLGLDSYEYIAWSALQEKVKPYYECCK